MEARISGENAGKRSAAAGFFPARTKRVCILPACAQTVNQQPITESRWLYFERLNATGWPGGSLRSLLQRKHRISPRMPPAGPVDRYAPRYRGQQRSYLLNATGLPGGSLRSSLQWKAAKLPP